MPYEAAVIGNLCTVAEATIARFGSSYHSQAAKHDGKDGAPFGPAEQLEVSARVQLFQLRMRRIIRTIRAHYLAQNGKR